MEQPTFDFRSGIIRAEDDWGKSHPPASQRPNAAADVPTESLLVPGSWALDGICRPGLEFGTFSIHDVDRYTTYLGTQPRKECMVPLYVVCTRPGPRSRVGYPEMQGMQGLQGSYRREIGVECGSEDTVCSPGEAFEGAISDSLLLTGLFVGLEGPFRCHSGAHIVLSAGKKARSRSRSDGVILWSYVSDLLMTCLPDLPPWRLPGCRSI